MTNVYAYVINCVFPNHHVVTQRTIFTQHLKWAMVLFHKAHPELLFRSIHKVIVLRAATITDWCGNRRFRGLPEKMTREGLAAITDGAIFVKFPDEEGYMERCAIHGTIREGIYCRVYGHDHAISFTKPAKLARTTNVSTKPQAQYQQVYA